MSAKKILVTVFSIIVLAGIALWVIPMYYYPYGKKGAAMPVVYFALRTYARDHAGKYPEATNDEVNALFQLIPRYIEGTDSLAGLSGDKDAVRTEFSKNPKYVPSSSWVYLGGCSDSPSEAPVFYERTWGVDQLGRRISLDKRAVMLNGGMVAYIGRQEWGDFISKWKVKQEPVSQR